MGILLDLAYLAAAPVALPVLLRKRLRTGKYRSGLAARFGLGAEAVPMRQAGTRTLLLHCVSVGELNSVQTLILRLLLADPALRIVVTTGTDTGTDRARKLFAPGAGQRVFPVRFPFDFSFAIERLFDRTRPDAIVLAELETWPNFLEIAAERRIPVAIINGRISDRSFPRYQVIRPVMAAMLRQVTWVGAQTATIAGRFAALGARDVQVLPTLKYDNATVADRVPGQEALAGAMGLLPEHQLFVAGSTGPGEEEAVLDAYNALRDRFPRLRLALVPRHPEVVPQVIAAIQRHGLEVIRRTDRPDAGEPSTHPPLDARQVFLLNTMGELRKLYALAFAVFVGRSLFARGGGGSDMIEVAALGKPCCFGPHTSNFAEVVEMLLEGKAAVEVKDAGALTRTLEGWLADPAATGRMGREARRLVEAQQQARATDHYVLKLLQLVGLPAKP